MEEKLVVLDFTTNEVHIYPIAADYEPEATNLLESLGHNINNCEWMFTTGNIIYHDNMLQDVELTATTINPAESISSINTTTSIPSIASIK